MKWPDSDILTSDNSGSGVVLRLRLSEQLIRLSNFVVIHFLRGSSPLWAINLALIILGDIRNRIHNTGLNLWVAIRLLSGQRALDTNYKCYIGEALGVSGAGQGSVSFDTSTIQYILSGR